MSLEIDVEEIEAVAYESGRNDGYSAGYDDGYYDGQEAYGGEYDRGFDNGAKEGYDDGYAEAKSDFEDLHNVIRDIENDMHWTLQDGTADDLTALIAHVKKWQDRIRTELEDAPL